MNEIIVGWLGAIGGVICGTFVIWFVFIRKAKIIEKEVK